jgi:hypothetical protein
MSQLEQRQATGGAMAVSHQSRDIPHLSVLMSIGHVAIGFTVNQSASDALFSTRELDGDLSAVTVP